VLNNVLLQTLVEVFLRISDMGVFEPPLGVTSTPLPALRPLLPLLPSPPLEVGPLNPPRGSGGKLLQHGLGRCPSWNRILCILALKSGGNKFSDFHKNLMKNFMQNFQISKSLRLIIIILRPFHTTLLANFVIYTDRMPVARYHHLIM